MVQFFNLLVIKQKKSTLINSLKIVILLEKFMYLLNSQTTLIYKKHPQKNVEILSALKREI